MAARREGEHPASPWRPGAPGEDRDSGASPSAILLVGLVGATATTAAVSPSTAPDDQLVPHSGQDQSHFQMLKSSFGLGQLKS
nr:unnamed protein product [Digitaria exilis]